MKPIFRITAAVMAVVLSTAAFGCENKKKTDESNETETTTAAQEETTSSDADDNDTTTADASSTGAASTTEISATTVTTTAAETTSAKNEEKKESAPQKGFDSSFDAAKAYYNAYLTGNAEAVYDMFCTEEMEGYHAYLNSTDLLDGKNPQVVFKRSNVIDAIKKSMDAIYGIMGEKSDIPHDKWTCSLTEETLKNTGENELKDFNKTLSTNFTAAADCGHVYYKDGDDEHSFIGNACAFVELDGRWYLSYSTVLNAELITYMDIF